MPRKAFPASLNVVRPARALAGRTVLCPACGRPGLAQRFEDGSRLFWHRGRVQGSRVVVLDACAVDRDGRVEEPYADLPEVLSDVA